MRQIIPDEISSLALVIAPYMVFNDSKTKLVLRADAPEEVKIAKEKYHKWFEDNQYLY